MKNLLLLLALAAGALRAEPLVAIQPLGAVEKSVIDAAAREIREFYAVEVEILPAKPLPKAAYYKPRDRYKADDVIDFLAEKTPEKFAKVLGLTAADISAMRDDGALRQIE